MTESLPNSVLSAIAARAPAQAVRLDDPVPVDAVGYSGNPLYRIRAHGSSAGREVQASYIVKRPSRSPVTYVFGGDPEFEAGLFEHGVMQAVNRVAGLHAPLVAVVRDEETVWLIMEDVSADLATWKGSMSVPPRFEAEKILVDRLARLHVSWEGSRALDVINQVGGAVGSARRARWCESAYRAWLAGDAPPLDGGEGSQRTWDSAQWAREPVLAFLDWLPVQERKRWTRHMTCRDAILRVSGGLPETLIHGDATPDNTGLRLSEPQETIVLIDWELAGPGMPAWELVHHLWNPPWRPATSELQLLEYYYQRYCLHGGSAMDRALWERSVNVTMAQYGVGLFPLFAGMALAGDRRQAAMVRSLTDRVREAFAAMGL